MTRLSIYAAHYFVSCLFFQKKRLYLQKNKDAIMQNYVNFAEGEFRLSISRETAKALGISDEIYDKYAEHVDVSNECLLK